MGEILLRSIEALELADEPGGCPLLGGNQYWLAEGGGGACSTTAAANICAYLLYTRGGGQPRAAAPADRGGMLALMEDVRADVHPRVEEFGCMAPSFAQGLDAALARFGLPYRTERLDVPKGAKGAADAAGRPTPAMAQAFLAEALAQDLPAAFLNLGRGFIHFSAFFGKGVPAVAVERARDAGRPPAVLDDWHWVTVTGVAWDDAGAGGCKPPLRLRLLDNNDHYWIDLGAWLGDARNTGAFVRLRDRDMSGI